MSVPAVDDSLSTVDRLLLMGRSTYAPQRVVMLTELKEDCFKVPRNRFLPVFLPIIKNACTDAEPAVRIAAFNCLPHLAGFLIQDDPEIGYSLVFDSLLFPYILTALAIETKPAVKPSIVAAFLSMSAHMRVSERLERILTFLTPACDPESPEELRINCCILIEALTNLFNSEQSGIYLVTQVCALTEDPSAKVREALVPCFLALSAINCDISKKLAPFYFRLVGDFQWSVRVSSVTRLGDFCRLLADRSPAIPVMKKALVDPSIWVSKAAIQHCGFWLGLFPDPPVELKTDFAEFLFCLQEGVDSRDRAVAQGLATAAAVLGKSAAKNLLHAAIIFSKSADEASRAAVALAVPALAPIIKDPAELVTLVTSLAFDTSAVATQLIAVFPAIVRAAPDFQISGLIEVLAAAVRKSGDAWRKRLSVILIFPELLAFSKEISRKILAPLWLRLLADPAHAVRVKAAEATPGNLKLLFPGEREVASFIDHFLKFFGSSPTSTRRQTFLRVSSKLPRDIFARAESKTAALARDPILDVRLTWAVSIGPQLIVINSAKLFAAAAELKRGCAGRPEFQKYLIHVDENSNETAERDNETANDGISCDSASDVGWIFGASETEDEIEQKKDTLPEDNEEAGEALKIDFS